MDMKNEKLFIFLKKFLDKEKIHIDYQELKFQLLSHPYYPSLNAIVGTLNHLHVKNYPIKIDETEENLNDLPDNFLTRTNENNAFVLVSKTKKTIKLVYEDLQKGHFQYRILLRFGTGKSLLSSQVNKLTSKNAVRIMNL